MRSRGLVALTAFACLIGVPAYGDAPARPTLFPGETKLGSRVTVLLPRVYVGELLEHLSRQTGVRLAVETGQGEVDGIQLIALVRDRPLRELMRALEDLFTHRWDRWEWQQEQDGRRYVLRHQRHPAVAAAAARAELVAGWTKDLRLAHQVASLPDAERDARMAGRPDLFPAAGSATFRGQPDLLKRISPRDLEVMLRGLETPLNPDDLSDREREALKLGLTPAPPVQGPRLAIRWEPPNLAPILWLVNGNVSANVIGGHLWDSGWLHSKSDGWLQAADVRADPYWARVTAGDATAGQRLPRLTLPEWLKTAAEKQGLNVLADPVSPLVSHPRTPGWRGRTPEQTVKAAVVLAALMAKQSGEIHLLRSRGVYLDPRAHLLAWQRIRDLREAASRNRGFLGLDQVTTAGRWNDPQIDGLTEEFPALSSSVMQQWRPVLQFYANLPATMQKHVLQPEGMPLRDTGLLARTALLDGPDPGNVRALALMQQHPREARVSLRLESQKGVPRPPDRRRRDIAGATERAPAPQAEEEVRVLLWQVQVPNEPPHTARWILEKRQPLRPE